MDHGSKYDINDAALASGARLSQFALLGTAADLHTGPPLVRVFADATTAVAVSDSYGVIGDCPAILPQGDVFAVTVAAADISIGTGPVVTALTYCFQRGFVSPSRTAE